MKFWALLVFATPIVGWGAAGHEITATIAQIHLFDSAKREISKLIYGDGHMATIASWPDRVRMIPEYRWSGRLHYTGPLGDFPPSKCQFGEQGWNTENDVLHAISNYTTRLQHNPADYIALRFLVHFLGDVHQPLHLTNRDRGGNGDNVLFEGRKTNLHSLWDTGLISRALRTLPNYTEPLNSPQIESNLRGAIYDPYIRFILWEGIRLWYRGAIEEWTTCPPAPIDSATEQLAFTNIQSELVCPLVWAKETHKIACQHAFQETYDPEDPPELDTEEYYGHIRNDKTIERLLAQGGLRLATVLNGLFAEEQDLQQASLNLAWLQ